MTKKEILLKVALSPEIIAKALKNRIKNNANSNISFKNTFTSGGSVDRINGHINSLIKKKIYPESWGKKIYELTSKK